MTLLQQTLETTGSTLRSPPQSGAKGVGAGPGSFVRWAEQEFLGFVQHQTRFVGYLVSLNSNVLQDDLFCSYLLLTYF